MQKTKMDTIPSLSSESPAKLMNMSSKEMDQCDGVFDTLLNIIIVMDKKRTAGLHLPVYFLQEKSKRICIT